MGKLNISSVKRKHFVYELKLPSSVKGVLVNRYSLFNSRFLFLPTEGNYPYTIIKRKYDSIGTIEFDPTICLAKDPVKFFNFLDSRGLYAALFCIDNKDYLFIRNPEAVGFESKAQEIDYIDMFNTILIKLDPSGQLIKNSSEGIVVDILASFTDISVKQMLEQSIEKYL